MHVREPGVLPDSSLNYFAKVTPTSHQRASFILDIDGRKRFLCALILTRIDYCNAALVGLPYSTLAPYNLQRVLQAVARFVLDLRPQDHVTVALQTGLPWVPGYPISYPVGYPGNELPDNGSANGRRSTGCRSVNVLRTSCAS